MVTILETLADYGTTTKDVEILTEHVRQSLKRTIVKQYLGEDGVLRVITLHPEVEELVSKSTQKTTSGSIPVLKPETITQLFDSINGVHQELTTQNVQHVILASPTTRLTFRKLISYNFPALAVISLNEVPNEVEIETVGMLSL